MDNLEEMYNEIIMEHSMNSYNKKKLSSHDFCNLGHNPNCGDEIEIDVLKGKTVKEAKDIIATFIGMIKREITDDEELEKLEDAIAFKNISNMPARVKCALLAWHTMEDILKKLEEGER